MKGIISPVCILCAFVVMVVLLPHHPFPPFLPSLPEVRAADQPGAPEPEPEGQEKKAEGKAEPADAPKGTPVYKYTGSGKRDPFVPLILKAEPEKKEKKRGQTPIENYELSEFKLIAVLWSEKGFYAVLRLPDGKFYTIQEGMKVGLHGGTAIKITKDSLVVRESAKDERGVPRSRDTVLKLRLEEEG